MLYIDQLRANVVAQLSKRGMNQADAGVAVNLRQSSISARLKGITQFRLSELLAIAELFGVSVHDLLSDVEKEYRAEQTERKDVVS